MGMTSGNLTIFKIFRRGHYGSHSYGAFLWLFSSRGIEILTRRLWAIALERDVVTGQRPLRILNTVPMCMCYRDTRIMIYWPCGLRRDSAVSSPVRRVRSKSQVVRWMAVRLAKDDGSQLYELRWCELCVLVPLIVLLIMLV